MKPACWHPLTQVANRRGLMQAFDALRACQQHSGHVLAVGLLDIDNFKRLNVDQLCKNYGDVTVFRDVSLQVASGEFVAIVGESGVGKSTLLNCMAGLDTWDHGQITLDGADVGGLRDEQHALMLRHQIGFVFQVFHVLPQTARESHTGQNGIPFAFVTYHKNRLAPA